MNKIGIKGLTLSELENLADSLGEKKFRGKQLFHWMYARQASDFAVMSTLTKALKAKLNRLTVIQVIKLVQVEKSALDGTRKFLFELSDNNKIEAVLIPPKTAFLSPEAKSEEEQNRLTICVSTQVGCPLGCKFCATATMGFQRNLTSGEIIDQIIQVNKATGRRITNLVYMGMGEPLLNYDELMKSIEIITTGMNIAAKHITVSTVGITDKIRRIADEKRKMKLAVSLHSLDEEIRAQLIPIAKNYPLQDLLNSVVYYYEKIKRRPTFEYILFDGINDRNEDIKSLIKLSRKIPCKINIIPFHNIKLRHQLTTFHELLPSPAAKLEEFARKLRESHVTVFIRQSAGFDISAACGQLATRNEPPTRRTPKPSLHSRSISDVKAL